MASYTSKSQIPFVRRLSILTGIRADHMAPTRGCQAPAGAYRCVVRETCRESLREARRFAHVGDQQADAVGELHDFTFAVYVEIDFVIAGGGMVDGVFQAKERL